MSMMNQKQILTYIKKINKSNINYWQKRSLNRLATSEIYTDARLPFIYEMYDGAYRQVDKMINEVFRTYGDALGGLDREKLKEMVLTNQGLGNYNARITRLESIKQDIEEKVMDMYANVEQAQEILYTNVLNNNYRNTINDISSLKGLSANFIEKGGAFATIDKRLVKALLKEPWTGNKNFSKRTWGQAKDLNAKLGKYINQAMISGQSYARVSREVRQAFEVKKYEADRLVRTETNYFHNQADLLANEELGINKYQYLAVMDNRTSEVCQLLDGQVFDTKDAKVGLNYPPMHPNCRSTTIPYIDTDKKEVKPEKVEELAKEETKQEELPSEAVKHEEVKQEENKKEQDKYIINGVDIREQPQSIQDISEIIGYNNIKSINNNKKVVVATSGMRYSFDLERLPKNVLKEQISHIEQLALKYPYVFDNKPFFPTLTTGNLGPYVLGEFNYQNGRLILSKQLFKNPKELAWLHNTGVDTGKSVKITKEKINFLTITHEYGHVLENGIIKHEAKLKNKISEFMADPNSFMIKGREDIKKMILNDVAEQLKTDYLSEEIAISLLGEYGIKGPPGEIFAESFALYELGDKTNPFAIAIKNILKSYGVI